MLFVSFFRRLWTSRSARQRETARPVAAPPEVRPAEMVYFPKPETPPPAVPHPAVPAPPPQAPAAVTPAPPPPPSPSLASQVFGAPVGELAKVAVGGANLLADVADAALTLGQGKKTLLQAGFGPLAGAVVVGDLVGKGLDALGVQDERLKKAVQQTVAAGPLGPSVALVHAARAALSVVSPETERQMSAAVRPLDFTDHRTPAGQLVQGVVGGIQGFFGGKPPEPPPPPPAPPPASPPPPPPPRLPPPPPRASQLAGAARKLGTD